KTLWLEAPNQLEDVGVDWEHYEVRIIIIAPLIERSTLELVNTINYPVDLIEVKRWVEGSSQFLFVDKLEPEQPKKIKPVRGLQVYDRDFYEAHHNKRSVEAFLQFAKTTQEFVKAKGWPLEMKFNRNYCGFKHGFFNVFGIKWMGSKTFAFFIKLPESVAQKIQPDGLKMNRYSNRWKQAYYIIDPSKTNVKKFLPLFQKALESVTGK